MPLYFAPLRHGTRNNPLRDRRHFTLDQAKRRPDGVEGGAA